MKNAKAKRTQVVLPVVSAAKRCLLLSGTPALNRPEELFTQANALLPKLFPAHHMFGTNTRVAVEFCSLYRA